MLWSSLWLSPAVATAAEPFPPEDDWVAFTQGGLVAVDPLGDRLDTGGHGDDAMDLLGTVAAPVVSWDASDTTLFLRLQIADAADLDPKDWGWLVDLDGGVNDDDFEFAILVQGLTHELIVWENTASTDGLVVAGLSAVDPAGFGSAATGETRTHTASGRFYVEAQLPRALLASDLGIVDPTSFQVAAVAGLAFTFNWEDTAPCDATIAGTCLALADVLTDPIVIDADEDQLSGPVEGRLGTDPLDADSDDDGLGDGDEALSTTDPLVCDTDGDGLPDGLERGAATPLDATDTGVGCFVADADPLTTTNPAEDDTDGGGMPDGVEDANHDGEVGYWEIDPNDPADDMDSDGDGVPDELDGRIGSITDVDSDGDGLDDATEGFGNSDSDDLPDFADTDSDDDTLIDGLEGADDPDLDGVPNFRDTDSDDDGVLDADEGDTEPDGVLDDHDDDGTPDLEDTDSDDDGILDGDESGDIDCDGIPNRIDLDDTDGTCDTDTTPGGGDDDDDDDTDGGGGLDQFVDGHLTGGACSTGPVGPTGALWLVGLALLRRRRTAAALALAVPSVALAQDVNAQRFAPVVDGGLLVKTVDLDVDTTPASIGVWIDYADNPFVFRPDDGSDEIPVLDSVTTARLLAAGSLGPLRLGVDIPVHLFAQGPEIDSPTHLGDLRLSAEVCALGTGAFHFGPTLDVTLPTGATDAYVGAGRTLATLGLAGAYDDGPVLLALNLGFRTGSGSDLGTIEVSPALHGALGAAVRLNDTLSIAGELDGEWWTGNEGEPGDIPAEALLSVRQAAPNLGAISLGIGTGLTEGIGAPDLRLMLGLTWTGPGPAEEPAPAAAEAGTGRVVVRAVDPSGHPIGGASVRVMETIGTPLTTGRDGILEATLAEGPHTVVVSASGWLQQERSIVVESGGEKDLTVVLFPEERVRIDPETGEIFLRDKVFFELDRAELQVDSLDTLDALAEVLLAHPDIHRVRIEGHTDSTGTAEHNLELSQERAEAVMAYLISQGIDASRLEAKGMGESRLLQEGDSEDVHATNRRVEFHVVQ